MATDKRPSALDEVQIALPLDINQIRTLASLYYKRLSAHAPKCPNRRIYAARDILFG